MRVCEFQTPNALCSFPPERLPIDLRSPNEPPSPPPTHTHTFEDKALQYLEVRYVVESKGGMTGNMGGGVAGETTGSLTAAAAAAASEGVNAPPRDRHWRRRRSGGCRPWSWPGSRSAREWIAESTRDIDDGIGTGFCGAALAGVLENELDDLRGKVVGSLVCWVVRRLRQQPFPYGARGISCERVDCSALCMELGETLSTGVGGDGGTDRTCSTKYGGSSLSVMKLCATKYGLSPRFMASFLGGSPSPMSTSKTKSHSRPAKNCRKGCVCVCVCGSGGEGRWR
ncbi:hypothetical protein Vafri_19891 [Volvox africanus]|uniref:Uncharacterized protein n=1 Tax=Volvox africanus TaxID=51714 RepID=A0A8J4BVM2_9CHLO|nr:hypothetical protein Vafri_19891 [Volvox africanus]